jgi:hypothetical protein
VAGVVPLRATLPEIRAFLVQHGITYPTLVDPGRVTHLYRVEKYPATVLIDRKGTLRFVHTGFRPGDETLLERMVRRWIRPQQVNTDGT